MAQHLFKLKVYAEDTDSFGIVHHANFLNYMERARQEWLYELGFKLNDLIKENILFVIKHAELDFFLPAKMYDNLIIVTKVVVNKKASTTYEQEIRSEDNNKLYCRGLIQVVCVNEALRPRPLPQELMEKIT